MSIRLEKVSHCYPRNKEGKVYAVKEVTLEIKKGEFIGLIGHTGSGKSTLIQHLNGLLKPSEGVYTFDGQDVHGENFDRKQLRSRVGMTFQYPEHQLFEVTVLKDVCYGPKNMGHTDEEAQLMAKKALEAVGMEEKDFEKSPFELSGGQKRRVAIAGVLAMDVEYLILDEPTAGLDPYGRKQILELLKKLHEERGMTIILVSHSMEDVADYAKRLLVMSHGSLVYDGIPKEAFVDEEKMEEMELTPPEPVLLMKALADRGFVAGEPAITLPEAKKAILQALSNGRKKGE